MRAQRIRIACEGAASLPIVELSAFQGALKTLPEESYARLRTAIAEHGFSFPVSVWRRGKRYHIIDGHQRVVTVQRMLEDGFFLPGAELPVDWVEAQSLKEAKQKVLLAASQYGRYTEDGVSSFIQEAQLEWSELKEEIDLPQIEEATLRSLFESDEEEDDVDQVPPKKARTRAGDLYELGPHRLICGDSTDAKTVARILDAPVRLQVVDPPFDFDYSRWEIAEGTTVLYVWGRGDRHLRWMMGLPKPWKITCTFVFTGQARGWARPEMPCLVHEVVYVVRASATPKPDWRVASTAGFRLTADGRPFSHLEKLASRSNEMSWQKSTGSMEAGICYTAPGDLVWDPCAGSGSSLLAAHLARGGTPAGVVRPHLRSLREGDWVGGQVDAQVQRIV